MAMLMKRYPDKPLNELIKHTHSYTYAMTLVEQLGKKVERIEVPTAIQFKSMQDELISNSKLLKSYGLTANDKVPYEIVSMYIHLK